MSPVTLIVSVSLGAMLLACIFMSARWISAVMLFMIGLGIVALLLGLSGLLGYIVMGLAGMLQ
jgi:hypothetical protein